MEMIGELAAPTLYVNPALQSQNWFCTKKLKVRERLWAGTLINSA